MRSHNAQGIARSYFVFLLPDFVAQLTPMHPTTVAEQASTQSPRANFWHHLSLTFLPLGVFGQGVFVYHGFAVQLAPWFASLVQCVQKSQDFSRMRIPRASQVHYYYMAKAVLQSPKLGEIS
jgi:hypothetical protein